jgi:preprotein translocase subunit SecA
VNHYELAADRRHVVLNAAGRRLVRQLSAGGTESPSEASLSALYDHVQRAIHVNRDYLPNRHYLVRGGEVVIVDEFTGRLAEGRRWRDGIHQAIEAREGLAISPPSDDAARITVQDYMLRYERLAGMTGTAANSARELERIYRTPVVLVPTHRPARRMRLPEVVCLDSAAKWRAIVAEVQMLQALGRPVLVGTRSIDKSERLSALLRDAGIEHNVLSAREVAREAEIVAAAGQRGRVTVATNMAGRGTDITLPPEVIQLGGLHVIVSELHESSRIDRQLIGRCGRQGDPGSYRVFLALDDDILAAGLGPERASGARHARQFYQAQARVEREHFRGRERLLEHERERSARQLQMGQDPLLDAA